MKNIAHLIWVAIAIAAFAIGSLRRSDMPPTEDSREAEKIAVGKRELSGARKSPEEQKRAADQDVAGGESAREIAVKDLVAEAFGDSNPLKRSLAFAKLLERMDAELGKEILAQLKAHGRGKISREQMPLLFFAWGDRAGAEAMEFDFGDMDEETRNYLQSQMLSGWASSDPVAAIAWLESLGEDPESHRNRTLNKGLISGLMAEDIDRASDYVLGLAEAGHIDDAEDYFREMGRQQTDKIGFDAALRWGENLPAGEGKAAALDSVVHNYGKRDPLAASAWAEQFAGEDWAAAVVSRVAEDWAEEDAVASINWLESLPQGASRSKASYTAFREWVRRDSAAASSYILEMEGSPARDNAVLALSRTIEGNDPEAAVKWADEISDPEMRAGILESSARSWMRRDEAAAREWLETSGLPQEVREKIAP